jgi:hypothetical protein
VVFQIFANQSRCIWLQTKHSFDMINQHELKSNIKVSSVHGMNYEFLNKNSLSIEPADELVEGWLVKGSVSMLYGPTNVGKTFITVDLACAVSRGIDWFGAKTEKGVVLYLAAEAPRSVKTRCFGYAREHGCELENLVVVDSSVNLFSDSNIVGRIAALVKEIEEARGLKVNLIIGDTLAILSAGANENSGQDMGSVMKNVGAIAGQTAAHFLLTHHTGKTLGANARGWSGVTAFVDTELAIVVEQNKPFLTVTKQRDLDSKGKEISFALKTVTVGKTKFGADATTCVVIPGDSKRLPKQATKKLGLVEREALKFIETSSDGLSRLQIKNHMFSRSRQSVERALGTLLEKKLIVMNGELFISARNLELLSIAPQNNVVLISN